MTLREGKSVPVTGSLTGIGRAAAIGDALLVDGGMYVNLQ